MKSKIAKLEKGIAVNFKWFTIQHRHLEDRYGTNGYFVSTAFPFNHPLSVDGLREAGNLLVEIANQLEKPETFSIGQEFYYVTPAGKILKGVVEDSSCFYALLNAGNVFKTYGEAEANKESVLNENKHLKKYLRM